MRKVLLGWLKIPEADVREVARLPLRPFSPPPSPPPQAGDAVAKAVIDPEVIPGAYYDRKSVRPSSPVTRNVSLQQELWEVTRGVLVSDGYL